MNDIMKKEELAALLNGREYREEMSTAEELQAKESGLVVVFAYSDDNCEFRGAICEEIGCWRGDRIFFNKDGSNFTDGNGNAPLAYMQDKSHPEANMIEAVWSPEEPACSWIYQTEIPHSTFDVLEDGELFCRGIVFSVSDLK